MNREFHPFLLSFELRKDSYFTVHKLHIPSDVMATYAVQ